jgi:hypothetical protein
MAFIVAIDTRDGRIYLGPDAGAEGILQPVESRQEAKVFETHDEAAKVRDFNFSHQRLYGVTVWSVVPTKRKATKPNDE